MAGNAKHPRHKLWDAVNEYAKSCGGDTSRWTIGNRRFDAINAVESATRLIAQQAADAARAAAATVCPDCGPVSVAIEWDGSDPPGGRCPKCGDRLAFFVARGDGGQ